jgi:peptidoglycan/LPS O-acetylase OafA/YrhL
MQDKANRIAYLDGWRGIAILFVIADHFSGGLLPFGSLGVELFFVLSGRLMADILLVRKIDIPTFFQRRFSRIYPALLVFATAMLAVSVVGGLAGAPLHLLLEPSAYLAAITFTTNYYEAWTHTSSVLGHVWSLSVEEHSYVLLALLVVIVIRNARAAAFVSLAIAIAAMANGAIRTSLAEPGAMSVYWLSDVRMASIFASVALFVLIDKVRVPAAAPIVAAILGLSMWILPAPDMARYTVGTLLLAFAINTIDLAPKAALGALSFQPLAMIGIWSYSLYLWKQPFYKVAEIAPWWATPILVAAMFVATLVSFYGVEQPARRYINGLNLFRRRQAIAAV